MIESEDLLTPKASTVDENIAKSLRPLDLESYIGQNDVSIQIALFMQAAKQRGSVLDHCLIYGPPGLGKTTLANVIANEMGGRLIQTSGPILERSGDLAAILTKLEANDLLFIDEIHRLNPAIEEILYPALEDFRLDIMVGEGVAAHSLQLDLAPFTLIGATTRAGMLTSPLRERFGIVARLQFYSVAELQTIITRSAQILNIDIKTNAAYEIAKRSRATPRIANRLLRRIRDFSDVQSNGVLHQAIAKKALKVLKVDGIGLESLDREYLTTLIIKFGGGPVGIDTIATAIGEEKGTIEDMIEPYLIQKGFVMRSLRGRIATDLAYQHLGLKPKGKLI